MQLRDLKTNLLRLVKPTGDDEIVGIDLAAPNGEFVRIRLNDLFSDQVADLSTLEVAPSGTEDYRPLGEWLALIGQGGGGTVAWLDITGKPTAFPPSAHRHNWSDLDGVPTLFDGTWASLSGKPTLFDGTWNSLTGKPTSFTPSAHTHPWSEVTGKPATFPPSAHTHPATEITGLAPVATTGSYNSLTDLPDTSQPGAAFPSGTRMLFVQTAAPTGWTKDTTHDDKALRVVSGTASSGGTSSFSSIMAAGRSTGGSVGVGTLAISGSISGTTLTAAQIPGHNHAYGQASATLATVQAGSGATVIGGVSNILANTNNNTGGGSSHTHSHTLSISGAPSFSAGSISMAVQYVDVIIATKD